MEIKLRVMKIDPHTFKPVQTGEKTIYSADGRQASKWVREPLEGLKTTQDLPQMTNYLNVQTGKCYGSGIENALGYFHNAGNNVYSNAISVGMYTAVFSNGHGLSVIPENFMRVVALFCARKSIKGNWINDKDEYLIPNTEHPDYEQWNRDAIVYSLFNVSSQQSSLRDIEAFERPWNIVNQFFFLSNEEMKQLADENSFNEMYQDAKAFPNNRYIYDLLQHTPLSDDARDVLESAKQLIRNSMSFRQAYHEANPQYHLHAWDAGWAQLKPMLKEYYKADLGEFIGKYKAFEARMKEGVYTFGFLKQ